MQSQAQTLYMVPLQSTAGALIVRTVKNDRNDSQIWLEAE
jgi:hypothetical protein